MPQQGFDNIYKQFILISHNQISQKYVKLLSSQFSVSKSQGGESQNIQQLF